MNNNRFSTSAFVPGEDRTTADGHSMLLDDIVQPSRQTQPPPAYVRTYGVCADCGFSCDPGHEYCRWCLTRGGQKAAATEPDEGHEERSRRIDFVSLLLISTCLFLIAIYIFEHLTKGN